MGVEDAAGPAHGMEDALESIGTTLDERTTCQELAAHVCGRACDAAAVDLLTEDVPSASPASGPRPALERAATAGRIGLLEPWSTSGARPLSVRALDEGHPITAFSGPAGEVARQVMSVPLLGHDRLYGVLLAVRQGPPFSDRDTALMHYAARLTAVHLGHARHHAAVRGTVFRLQRALLAEPGRPHPNLDLATRYLPAGGGTLVGGDWFETVRLHFGRTLLVMGDVMGHGLDAAVDMNAYRSMLRYMASTDLPPHPPQSSTERKGREKLPPTRCQRSRRSAIEPSRGEPAPSPSLLWVVHCLPISPVPLFGSNPDPPRGS